MNQYENILIGLAFIFCFLAAVSTSRSKSIKHFIVFFGLGIVYIVLLYVNLKPGFFSYSSKIQYFFAVGFFLPQLLARFYIQYQIKSPVEFVNRRVSTSSIIAMVVFSIVIVFYISIATHPSRMNYITGEGIYSDEEVQYKISFIITLMLGGLFMLYLGVQRTAFCANGLLIGGLLWGWSRFKSYKWENEELYQDSSARQFLDESARIELTLNLHFTRIYQLKRLHFFIPFNQKDAINNLLAKNISPVKV